MGYCMNQGQTDFGMDVTKKDKALNAIKRLMGEKERYSWVERNSVLKSETLEEVLDEWRWEVSNDSDGNITYISFVGEKLGDDYTLFKAIAPYVDPYSYIEMHGEDGCHWRWYFEYGTCYEQYPVTKWPDVEEPDEMDIIEALNDTKEVK